MVKNDIIKELTNLLALAVVHKIGSIVGFNEIFSKKYEKEVENFIQQAGDIKLEENWNNYDKEIIKNETKSKILKKLKEKDYLNESKYDFVDREIEKVLKKVDLI